MLYYVAVIIVHNHPSGEPEASEDDIKLIKGLAEAAEIVNRNVLNTVKKPVGYLPDTEGETNERPKAGKVGEDGC